jgi:hypothetical protein
MGTGTRLEAVGVNAGDECASLMEEVGTCSLAPVFCQEGINLKSRH